ncbi:MAG: hypothetical protein AB7O26_00720 [Planctomycetaceae bacterium]
MNDARRKRMIYGLLGAVVLYFAGEWAYGSFYATPLDELNARNEDLQKKMLKRTNDLTKARRIKKQIAAWNDKSLPSDTELARSLYLAWLVERVKAAGIESPNVDSGAAANRRGLYQSLSFSVRGQGTLEQLTRFLFDFYRADHLHQIQSLGITPLRNQGKLDLSVSIEALVLPEAERTDSLSDKTSPRFAARQIADYRVIPQRNLFGAGGGASDPAAQTWLSGVTAKDSEPEAWFDLRATNKTVRLRTGDRLEIGDFLGTIVSIQDSDVLIESDGEQWLISVGENLDQAYAVPREIALP